MPYIQKTGLALAGFDEYLRSGRVLIFGESEIRFLEQLSAPERAQTLRRLFSRDLPCVMVTMGLEAAPELIAEAERMLMELGSRRVGATDAVFAGLRSAHAPASWRARR